MRGLAQLLEHRHAAALDDEGRELVGHILSAGARGEALVQAILAYARVGGEQAIANEPVDAAACVADVVRSLGQRIDESGATVSVSDLPVVRGDADLLGQLFQNLLSNALSFRAPDAPPRIDIGATPEGTRWRFRVAANGIGVAPEDRERIFELFTQLRPSAYPGTGTGLPVSRRIVERHGGQIHVEDNQPAGSVFSFTLSAGD
jgi:signal transduction histidine kinase